MRECVHACMHVCVHVFPCACLHVRKSERGRERERKKRERGLVYI